MSQTAREKLQAAIDAYNAGVADAQKAVEALNRAKAFLGELEASVAEFKNLDDEIAASRAENIERAMVAGETPTLDASPDLVAAAAKRADAENKLASAEGAIVSIEKKLADLNEKVARLDLEREWAAEAVLAAEAHSAAIAFHDDLAELRRKYYWIFAATSQRVRLDPKTLPKAIYPGQHVPAWRPVNVSIEVSRAINESVLGNHEERHGLAMRNGASNAVSGLFTLLKYNADATLEDSKL